MQLPSSGLFVCPDRSQPAYADVMPTRTYTAAARIRSQGQIGSLDYGFRFYNPETGQKFHLLCRNPLDNF